MGVACVPDIFQESINWLLGNLDYVSVYIDDILILQKKDEPDEEHLQKIEMVLGRLQAKGFWVNLKKSFFMQPEIKHLGYLLTSGGIKPQPKKVEAMLRMQRQKNWK